MYETETTISEIASELHNLNLNLINMTAELKELRNLNTNIIELKNAIDNLVSSNKPGRVDMAPAQSTPEMVEFIQNNGLSNMTGGNT